MEIRNFPSVASTRSDNARGPTGKFTVSAIGFRYTYLIDNAVGPHKRRGPWQTRRSSTEVSGGRGMSEPLSHSQVLAFARAPCYIKPKEPTSAVKRWARTSVAPQVDSPREHASDASRQDTPRQHEVSTWRRGVSNTLEGLPRPTMTRHERPEYGSKCACAMEHASNGGKMYSQTSGDCKRSGEEMNAGQRYDDAKARHKELLHAWPDSCEPPRPASSSWSQWLFSPKSPPYSPPPGRTSQVPPTAGSTGLHSSVVASSGRGGRFHPPVVVRGPHSSYEAPLVFQIGHPRNAVRPPSQARALLRLPGMRSSSPRSLRLANPERHVWTAAALNDLWGTLPAHADGATPTSPSSNDDMIARQLWRDAPLHRTRGHRALDPEE